MNTQVRLAGSPISGPCYRTSSGCPLRLACPVSRRRPLFSVTALYNGDQQPPPGYSERKFDGSAVSPPPEKRNSPGKWAATGAVVLGVAMFALTRFESGAVTLSTLERNTVPLDTALRSDRPALVEFYASWCAVCRELAPDVYKVEQEYKDKVSFVMLNIENPKWAPEMAEYRVGGIPHFVWLNSRGETEAAAVGRLPMKVLEGNVKALSEGVQLPFGGGGSATPRSSSLPARNQEEIPSPSAVSPRSHGLE